MTLVSLALNPHETIILKPHSPSRIPRNQTCSHQFSHPTAFILSRDTPCMYATPLHIHTTTHNNLPPSYLSILSIPVDPLAPEQNPKIIPQKAMRSLYRQKARGTAPKQIPRPSVRAGDLLVTKRELHPRPRPTGPTIDR